MPACQVRLGDLLIKGQLKGTDRTGELLTSEDYKRLVKPFFTCAEELELDILEMMGVQPSVSSSPSPSKRCLPV